MNNWYLFEVGADDNLEKKSYRKKFEAYFIKAASN